VLSLKFCPHISTDAMLVISQSANPFFLRELYLDGCEKITDDSLRVLCSRSDSSQFLLEALKSE